MRPRVVAAAWTSSWPYRRGRTVVGATRWSRSGASSVAPGSAGLVIPEPGLIEAYRRLGPQAPDEAGILGVLVAEQLDRHRRPSTSSTGCRPDPCRRPPATGTAASGRPGGSRWQPGPWRPTIRQISSSTICWASPCQASSAWVVPRLSWWTCVGCGPGPAGRSRPEPARAGGFAARPAARRSPAGGAAVRP